MNLSCMVMPLRYPCAPMGHVRCLSSCSYITGSGETPPSFLSSLPRHTPQSFPLWVLLVKRWVTVSMALHSLNLFIYGLLSPRLREITWPFKWDIHDLYSFLSNIYLVKLFEKNNFLSWQREVSLLNYHGSSKIHYLFYVPAPFLFPRRTIFCRSQLR